MFSIEIEYEREVPEKPSEDKNRLFDYKAFKNIVIPFFLKKFNYIKCLDNFH